MANSMVLDLYDLDRDIELHGWKEVTTATYFVQNTTELHPNGLFSKDIFGEPGTVDREKLWGYISLNDTFMNPQAYYVLARLKKNIAEDMKTGSGRYYVDSVGEVTKLPKGQTVPESAKYKVIGSGFDWLKEAWPHISWRVTKDMTKTAKVRRKFLKTFPINAIFWDKFPVIPAFYRDVDYKSRKQNVINKNYIKLIHLAKIIKTTDNLLFSDDYDTPLKSNSYAKCQDLMNEIAEGFLKQIGGANGFINKYITGKTTDYGARLVISTSVSNSERPEYVETDYYHSAVPMSVAINIFAPFMIYNVKQWVTNYVSGKRFISVYNHKTKEYESKEIAPSFLDEFTSDNIRKYMDLYKKNKMFRVKPITLKGVDGERIPIQARVKIDPLTKKINIGINSNNEDIDSETKIVEVDNNNDVKNMQPSQDMMVIRNISFCEFFYIIAEQALKNKCIDICRYPVDDYYHVYPSLMNIIPANKYKEVFCDGILYKRYPMVSYKNENEIEHMFTDSLKMFSIYPASLGGDFDGDQVSVQGIFSDEANAEAIKQMNNLSHFVGLSGEVMRTFPLGVRHGLHCLTYMNKKPEVK